MAVDKLVLRQVMKQVFVQWLDWRPLLAAIQQYVADVSTLDSQKKLAKYRIMLQKSQYTCIERNIEAGMRSHKGSTLDKKY
jgi:hypothetical protein